MSLKQTILLSRVLLVSWIRIGLLYDMREQFSKLKNRLEVYESFLESIETSRSVINWSFTSDDFDDGEERNECKMSSPMFKLDRNV